MRDAYGCDMRCCWVRDAYGVRDAHYNVISVLGVRVAAGCEMRIFLDWCESLCPQTDKIESKMTILLNFVPKVPILAKNNSESNMSISSLICQFRGKIAI